MSHVVTIDCEINDLDALAQAAKRIGLELVRDQRTYKWWGHSVGDYPIPAGFTEADLGHCLHALRVAGKPGAYEIGVVARRDGRPGYTLIYDFYGGGQGLMKVVGQGCKNLLQPYSICAAARKARRLGHRVREQKLANGKVKLILER